MRNSRMADRHGRLADLVVVAMLVLVLLTVGMPVLLRAQISQRDDACRNRIRQLSIALTNNAARYGKYPGYMNALQLQDGKGYVDPTTKEVTPVSWAVMILPDLDRSPLFDQWRMPTEDVIRNSQFIKPRTVYIDMFVCPDDPPADKMGTPISYVVNTGLPDAPAATKPTQGAPGMPRDWAANGMFFDNFSEHPLVKKSNPGDRGPMEFMRDERVRDMKSRTIMLTENVDAGSYVLDAKTHGAENWKGEEIAVGCIWKPSKIGVTTAPPTMQANPASLQINAEAGKGTGKDFDHCRPSSKHAGGVNAAFVDASALFLSEKISYFVFAKLMTSDDETASPAGKPKGTPLDTTESDKAFKFYQLSESNENLAP